MRITVNWSPNIVETDRLWIGGDWQSPHQSSSVLEITGAATEEIVGRVPCAGPLDVDRAVAAARSASDDPNGWPSWTTERRVEVIAKFADSLARRADELVSAVSVQNGMPVSIGSTSEGVAGPALLRYYAAVASSCDSEESRARVGGGTTLVRKSPVGVIAAIVPWNFPVSLAFFKLAPALAAGCTVVWKPSPETVLDALIVVEASIEAGLPAGVLNLIPGGRETGAYLVSHPDVDKVAFTGSTAAGQAIAEACGRLLRPVTLELGGKSAAIVLDDADLDQHNNAAFAATLLNSGQTCYLSTRILAPRSRYEEVVDFFGSLASDLRVGDPLDPSTQIGPLATRSQRDRVEGFIATARNESRLVVGGGRPLHLDRGWFVNPTVFADVAPSSKLAREEVFGPVLAITPYDSEDEAVRLANDSDFGLAGTVWTEDADRGLSVARRMHTGAVGINGFRLDIGSPFGGLKASGLGQELGPEGMAAYQATTSVFQTFA